MTKTSRFVLNLGHKLAANLKAAWLFNEMRTITGASFAISEYSFNFPSMTFYSGIATCTGYVNTSAGPGIKAIAANQDYGYGASNGLYFGVTSPFSIMLSFQPTILGAAQSITCYALNSATGSWSIWMTSSNTIAFGRCGANSYWIKTTGSTVLALGNIYNIVCTYDGTNLSSGLSIYINGNPETLTPSNNGTIVTLSDGAQYSLFRDYSTMSGVGYSSGIIGYLMVFNICLTQNSISLFGFDPFHMFRPIRLLLKHRAHTPVITPATGLYTSAQSITITQDESLSIYYTDDGSTPTGSSPVYSAPITASVNKNIQAVSQNTNWFDSAIPSNILAITDSTGPTYDDTTITAAQDGDGIKIVTPAGTSAYHPPVAYKVYARKGATPTFTDTYLVAESPDLTIWFDRDADGVLLTTGNWNILVACIDAASNVTQGMHEKIVALAVITAAPVPVITSHASMSNYTAAISMSTTLAGGSIYYTTDGSTPTVASTLYTAPFNIFATTTIKAVTIKTGYLNSAVCTAVVTIEDAPPVTDPVIESILENLADVMGEISTATGYHNNIALSTREAKDWPNLSPNEYPAAMPFSITESDVDNGATEQNVLAEAQITIRGAIYAETNIETAISNFIQDIERCIMVDGTRGGVAVSTVAKGKVIYENEKTYTRIFDLNIVVTYQYKHGNP